MNTPAHAVVNLVLLGRRAQPDTVVPILAGALLPDLPMLGFYFYQKLLNGVSENVIWSTLYFEPHWQTFFDIFNSLPLIAIGFALALWLGSLRLKLLFASMAAHVLFDLPLHHDDAHGHFFPLSDWRFESPVSYWDSSHYGNIVAPVEVGATLLGCIVLFWRYPTRWLRVTAAAIAVIYLAYWGYVAAVWA